MDKNFSEDLRHWLYDYASQGIVITDASLVVQGWNQWMEIHSNIPAHEAIGKNLATLYPSLRDRNMIQWYDKAVEGQVTILSHRFHQFLLPMEIDSKNPDLKLMQQTARIAPLLSQGKIMGTLTMIEDITERVANELELREKNTLLENTVAALKETESRLTQNNRNLEQFAYIASHDLQEPLRKITVFIELLENQYGGKMDGNADKLLQTITEGANRMSALIKDLLSYARIGSDTANFTPTDLNVVFSQVLADLELVIKERNAEVTRTDLPTVSANPIHMQRLLQNLISNALKFNNGAQPKIEVSANRKGGEWVIGVSDNGIGIEKKYLERIFQVFQRLHGRSQYPGSGLGLAICKKIVERHEGRIWVESAPGAGSTFYFSLPALNFSEQQKLTIPLSSLS